MKPVSTYLRRLIGASLRHSGLSHLVINVRRGQLHGLRWTLYPRTSYWRGTHEPEIADFIAGIPNLTGQTAWDLGAHYGYYSLLLARMVGPAGSVEAFEPNPFSFRKLQRHAELNQMPWLHVHRAAVGAKAGKIDMFSYNGGDDTTSHLAFPGEDTVRAPHSWPAEMCQLDEEVTADRIKPPQFIKLDVEGHGHHAIAGAREAIATTEPLIVAGLHSQEESEGIDDLLLPLGYQKLSPSTGSTEYTTGQLDVVYRRG